MLLVQKFNLYECLKNVFDPRLSLQFAVVTMIDVKCPPTVLHCCCVSCAVHLNAHPYALTSKYYYVPLESD